MKDVQIAYKCDDLHDYDSRDGVRELVDCAIERILKKVGDSSNGDGPVRIFVEHCQKEPGCEGFLGGLRYLKVHVEGQGPCIVMAY